MSASRSVLTISPARRDKIARIALRRRPLTGRTAPPTTTSTGPSSRTRTMAPRSHSAIQPRMYTETRPSGFGESSTNIGRQRWGPPQPGLVALAAAGPVGVDGVEFSNPAGQVLGMLRHQPDLVLPDAKLLGDEHAARVAHEPGRYEVVGRDHGGKPVDALGASAFAQQRQEPGAKPASLPFVDHRDRDFSGAGFLGIPDVPGHADSAPVGAECADRLVIVVVDARQEAELRLGQAVLVAQEARPAGPHAQPGEPLGEQLGILAADLSYHHRGPVAEEAWPPGFLDHFCSFPARDGRSMKGTA